MKSKWQDAVHYATRLTCESRLHDLYQCTQGQRNNYIFTHTLSEMHCQSGQQHSDLDIALFLDDAKSLSKLF